MTLLKNSGRIKWSWPKRVTMISNGSIFFGLRCYIGFDGRCGAFLESLIANHWPKTQGDLGIGFQQVPLSIDVFRSFPTGCCRSLVALFPNHPTSEGTIFAVAPNFLRIVQKRNCFLMLPVIIPQANPMICSSPLIVHWYPLIPFIDWFLMICPRFTYLLYPTAPSTFAVFGVVFLWGPCTASQRLFGALGHIISWLYIPYSPTTTSPLNFIKLRITDVTRNPPAAVPKVGESQQMPAVSQLALTLRSSLGGQRPWRKPSGFVWKLEVLWEYRGISLEYHDGMCLTYRYDYIYISIHYCNISFY